MKPALAQFRQALHTLYGPRLARIVLFGADAHAEDAPQPRYDIAVFLKTLPDRWAERDRLADLRSQFLDENGIFFDAKPFLISEMESPSPLMHEIRRDGREL